VLEVAAQGVGLGLEPRQVGGRRRGDYACDRLPLRPQLVRLASEFVAVRVAGFVSLSLVKAADDGREGSDAVLKELAGDDEERITAAERIDETTLQHDHFPRHDERGAPYCLYRHPTKEMSVQTPSLVALLFPVLIDVAHLAPTTAA